MSASAAAPKIRLWDSISLFAVVALCLVVWVPWAPQQFDVENYKSLQIDYSALLVMNDAFVKGKQFGIDVIHAYGPYSFLGTSGFFFPGTFSSVLIGKAFL